MLKSVFLIMMQALDLVWHLFANILRILSSAVSQSDKESHMFVLIQSADYL